MALMFPTVVPEYVRRDPYREAEVQVYEQLRDQLPDSYRCYYSRPWLGLTPAGEEKEGEADFVVAHPDRGFLVIEVKGGRVRRQEGTEQWVSTNRLNITNNVKDPVKQASDSKHALLRKLRDEPGWGRHFVTARHGVILPDCSRPSRDLGPAMPLFLFAFGDDMSALRPWVEERLSRHDGQDTPGEGLRADGMLALHRLLSGPIELRTDLKRTLSAEGREIDRLTRDQFEILTSLEDQRQMSVSGGAGTGKTLLALEKACRAGEAGERTLLVCFNHPLGEHLKRLSAGCAGVEAGSFHALCGAYGRRAGTLKAASGDRLYDEALPAALVDAVSADPTLAFDTIVVDEGQDFRDGWLTALRLCLKDPEEGGFYVFFDDNQRVYSREGGWLADLPRSRFHLTRNLRNTKAIHECSKPWYASPRATRPGGPDGQPVVWREAPRSADLGSAVAAAISELTGRHKLSRGEIAVLTPLPVANHPLVKSGMLCGAPFTSADDNAADKLVFDSVRRYKGLDRPVVLLVDADRLQDPELIYVALTRPSLLLYVFGDARTLQRLQEGARSIAAAEG